MHACISLCLLTYKQIVTILLPKSFFYKRKVFKFLQSAVSLKQLLLQATKLANLCLQYYSWGDLHNKLVLHREHKKMNYLRSATLEWQIWEQMDTRGLSLVIASILPRVQATWLHKSFQLFLH